MSIHAELERIEKLSQIEQEKDRLVREEAARQAAEARRGEEQAERAEATAFLNQVRGKIAQAAHVKASEIIIRTTPEEVVSSVKDAPKTFGSFHDYREVNFTVRATTRSGVTWLARIEGCTDVTYRSRLDLDQDLVKFCYLSVVVAQCCGADVAMPVVSVTDLASALRIVAAIEEGSSIRQAIAGTEAKTNCPRDDYSGTVCPEWAAELDARRPSVPSSTTTAPVASVPSPNVQYKPEVRRRTLRERLMGR